MNKNHHYFLPPLHCPCPAAAAKLLSSYHYFLSELFQNPPSWSPTNLNSVGGIIFFMRQNSYTITDLCKTSIMSRIRVQLLPWSKSFPFAAIITLIPFALAVLEHSNLSPPRNLQACSLAVLQFVFQLFHRFFT